MKAGDKVSVELWDNQAGKHIRLGSPAVVLRVKNDPNTSSGRAIWLRGNTGILMELDSDWVNPIKRRAE